MNVLDFLEDNLAKLLEGWMIGTGEISPVEAEELKEFIIWAIARAAQTEDVKDKIKAAGSHPSEPDQIMAKMRGVCWHSPTSDRWPCTLAENAGTNEAN